MSSNPKTKRWEKSRSNKIIDGVCAGLAEHLNVDPTLVRIIWLVALFFKGFGLIAYIAAMILVPAGETDPDQPQQKRKWSAPLVAGALLILFALMLIFRELHWHYDWFPYEPFPLSPIVWYGFWFDFWPLLLIGLGVVYLVYALRKSKKEETGVTSAASAESKKWIRSSDDRVIGGVCGGVAKNFHIDPSIFRVVVAVLALATNIVLWFVVYLILMVVLPSEEDKQEEQ